MNVEELKNKVQKLENKYYEKQLKFTNKYFGELCEIFYESADLNDNTDYEFDEVFKEIVSGEDCMYDVAGARNDALYYWSEDENGKTKIEELDFNLLKTLANKALTYYEKDKEKDFEIC